MGQGWATRAIAALQRGERVTIRPRGYSMKGRIDDGALVELAPCRPDQLAVGDAVLVQVRGSVLLHLIKARQAERMLIGNNRGGINGWVGSAAVRGVAVAVDGRPTRARRRVLEVGDEVPSKFR